jgi:aspartate kinase
MIVMKFDGASLSSPALIKRMVSVVRSEKRRQPVVIVSAFGDTRDNLINILGYACRAESYRGRKAQENLKNYHFSVAEDLLSDGRLDSLHSWMRSVFRDLHIRSREVCEGQRSLTPELRDWVLSLGEQLSNRILTAVLEEYGIPAIYKDARELILTDDRFTNAQPRPWETYARLHRSLPAAARHHVVVLGGFIGATEDGRTTMLGRGGSDLATTLVGAAVNAEEIQIWKDVNGLSTWDFGVKAGGYRVKRLSCDRISELAYATVLPPNAVAPTQWLHTSVVIRSTFQPGYSVTNLSWE